jgi:hypothetical protein
MARKLPPETFYQIRDSKNFYAEMRADIELLRSNRRYVSLATVIVCCLDALAAGPGEATYGKFEKFVKTHFPDFCSALESLRPGRSGSRILYDDFRNGFAHLRGPKSKFAIAEDHELGGDWADLVEVDAVVQFVAINIDRLAQEFLKLLDQLEK